MPATSDASPLSRNGASRWGRRSTLSGAASAPTRLALAPPALRCAEGAWQRLVFWLMAPAPHDAGSPPNRLHPARTGFIETLADIDGDDAHLLRGHIEQAQTLRELWHLRAEIYRVVGVALSQRQAEQRLALLNRHFPTRSPRSQFAAP